MRTKNFAKWQKIVFQTFVGGLIAICLAFPLSACGRGTTTTQPLPSPADFELAPTQPAVAHSPQPIHRLRILAPSHFAPVINEAAKRATHISIELTTYNPDTHAEYWANNLRNIIEGDDGFDIFFNDPHQPLLEIAQDGLLANFFDLINNCRHSELTDFYIQALHALTIDGGMYFFPLSFGLQYVGINNTAEIGQHYLDYFAQLETITLNRMMEIYLSIGAVTSTLINYAGDEEIYTLALANCRDKTFPGFMAWNMASGFIDLNQRESNLTNPAFVSFLENLMGVFPLAEVITPEISIAQNFRFNTSLSGVSVTPFGTFRYSERYLDPGQVWNYAVILYGGSSDVGYVSTPSTMVRGATRYLFAVHNDFLSPINAITPFYGNQYFSNFIPLADEQGRLVTNMATTFPWKTLSIVRGENAPLAWDFVYSYLLPASACHETTAGIVPVTPMLWARPNIGAHSFDTPILRRLASKHITDTLHATQRFSWQERYIGEYYEGIYLGWGEWRMGMPIMGIYEADDETIRQTIEAALSRINAMHDSSLSPMPIVPFELIEPTVLSMLRRMIDPEDAAEILDEIVSAWLSTNKIN